jgi:predicted flap endonuclease-1-like 5' DNA nuclease
MNNQKSRLFLWLGIFVGVSSAIFFILNNLSNKNTKNFSAILLKNTKIPSDEKQPEFEKGEKEHVLEVHHDNLKVIKGIGPAFEALLNKNNIFTFSELSATSVADLQKMLEKKNLRLANPETWPLQAKQFEK